MSYLLIENRVASMPSVELMRMLGASSSRGQDSKIGQFGSGFPYSLALLARYNLLDSLKICLGKDVYTFYTEDRVVRDSGGNRSIQSEICMKKQNGSSWNLNISTNFGGLDWHDVIMAVREFISNAIDGARTFDGTVDSVNIDKNIPEEGRNTRAKDEYVRVYLKLTPNIEEYVNHKYKYFKCLSPSYISTVKIFPNNDGGPAKVYRKGVLVGTMGTNSLFHYNVNDIDLKESRNVDSYEAERKCASLLANCNDVNIISRFLTAKLENKDVWESDFNSYYLDINNYHNLAAESKDKVREHWQQANKLLFNNKVVCENELTARIVNSKGMTAIVLDESIAKLVKNYGGIKTASDVLDEHELSGKEVCDANENTRKVLNEVWKSLTNIGMTFSKNIPDVKLFRQNTIEGGSLGYFKIGGNTIYIREDISEDRGSQLKQTVLEECAHYITGSSDYTRDFQEFAFKVATLFMKEI